MSGSLGVWASRLQPASWRGVPFVVRSSTIRRGRRVAVHEYPFRDDVWVEDLGRGKRTVSFTGRLVGDDVFAQRDAMDKAAEGEGSGILVHPSLGSIQVSLIDFSAGEVWDHGRVIELEFSFIQTGADQPLYPTISIATQAAVVTAAGGVFTASAMDFIADAQAALRNGVAVVQGVVGTVVGYVAQVVGTVRAVEMTVAQLVSLPAVLVGTVLSGVGQVVGLVNDAALGAKATIGLLGDFGRYAEGSLVTPLLAGSTVQSCLAALSANRAAVDVAAAAALASAAEAPTTLPAAVQAAVEALRTTIPDPADQLRLLAVLAGYNPAVAASTAPIGAATAAAQTAAAALIRRAACASLATAASNFQPASYDDATAALEAVGGALQSEMIAAADAGDTASYLALRGLLTAVSRDLLTRAASLPRLVTVQRRASLPSLVLAYQLYRDASRSDDLVARADPIHPLFMPTTFTALGA